MADPTIGAMNIGSTNPTAPSSDVGVNQPAATPAAAPAASQPGSAAAYDSTVTPAMPTNFGQATSFADASRLADAQPNSTFKTYESGASGSQLEETKSPQAFKTASSSVADQLSKILNVDSDLNRAVKASTREQAAGMGMGASSMALEAGQAALIKQAESIAAKDAETSAKFELQQQAASNQVQQTLAEAQVAGDLNVQKATIQEQSDKIKRAWESTMAGLNAEQQTEITNLTKSWDDQITRYQLAVQERMKNAELDANAEVMLMNQSNEMLNNYQVTVQQLLSNTEFMDSLGKDRTKMANIFNAMFGTVSSALQFSANAVGVGATMSPYIQQLIQQNSWTSTEAGA